MHNLNLDWIIKIAKDFLDQYTHIQELITNGEESIQNLTTSGLEQLQEKADALEALLQTWYEEHSEDIANQLADALSNLNDWYTEHQNYLNQTLTDNIALFRVRAEQIADEASESIPADYSQLSDDMLKLKKGFINSVNLIDYQHFLPGGYFNSNGVWVENNSVITSNYIPCMPNDIFYTNYYPSGTSPCFFDDNKDFVSAGSTVRDGKIVIPDTSTIRYFNFTFSSSTNLYDILMICKDIRPDIYVSPYIKDLQLYSLQDKNIMIFGDSFSSVGSRWLNQFKLRENPKSVTNLSVSGAHWRDYYNTPYPYDGNPQSGSYEQQLSNVLGNQVQKAMNGIANNTYPIPDVIFMFAGTNDNWNYEDNYTIESQFTDGTSIVPLTDVNRTIFAGAMRWCVQNIYSNINSSAEIIIITPAQCADGIADYTMQQKKATRIKEVAERMSLKVIDVFNESGIFDLFEERDTDRKWLVDGLHPNIKGGVKLGNFIADSYASKHITGYYSSVASWQ